jgi:metallo-beta-lactamase class B
VVGALTILILLLVLAAAYRWGPALKKASPPVFHAAALAPHPVTLVPGIHLLGGLAPAAAYVVETSAGLVLVDAGLDKEAGPLRQQMTELGLDWRRLQAILLTHVHGDHTGGAAYLRAATGATIYAGGDDVAILRAGKPREAFFSTFLMPADIVPVPTPVDEALDDGQIITVGDVRFQVLATPGHTPGSVCYLMERGDRSVLFSGDVIWSLSTQSRSLGTQAAYLAPRYRGNAQAFLATLRRLRAMPVPVLVLPGHPRLDPVPLSPAITQERWQALLDAGIADMERLQARYAKDGANFLDGSPKTLLPHLHYLGDLKDTAVYVFAVQVGQREGDAARYFVVDAPGPGLNNFLNDRLGQLGIKLRLPTAVLLTSGDAGATAGLVELVEKYRCPVVASVTAWKAVKSFCPAGTQFLAAEDLPAKGWFEVKPIALGGRGVGPVAYGLPWSQKAVLFSGRIPSKPTPEAAQALWKDFLQAPGSSESYQASLERLGTLKPDLWLPSQPINGQNANLYENDWKEVLDANAEIARLRGRGDASRLVP